MLCVLLLLAAGVYLAADLATVWAAEAAGAHCPEGSLQGAWRRFPWSRTANDFPKPTSAN